MVLHSREQRLVKRGPPAAHGCVGGVGRLLAVKSKRGDFVTFVSRLTAVGVLAIFIAGCGAGGHRTDSASAKQLKALINAEAPTGSTESQVTAFLDKRGFKYSNEIQLRGAIFAVAPLSSDGLVKTKLQIEFRFDERRRLRDYTVTESLVGP